MKVVHQSRPHIFLVLCAVGALAGCSHDLGVVHHLSDRVLVINQGEVVEHGEADDIFLRPQRPYTQSLVAAVPRLHLRAVA